MVKPEWGTKRTCPKCATRFYDLGKDDPDHLHRLRQSPGMPEPVLKSKQPMPFEAAKPEAEKVEKEDADLAADELVPDEDEEPSPTTKSIWRAATTISASPPATKTKTLIDLKSPRPGRRLSACTMGSFA